MLLPTQDKEAILTPRECSQILYEAEPEGFTWDSPSATERKKYEILLKAQIDKLECLGYHKCLLVGIEEE